MKLSHSDLEEEIRTLLAVRGMLPYSALQRKYNCSLIQILDIRRKILAEINASTAQVREAGIGSDARRPYA